MALNAIKANFFGRNTGHVQLFSQVAPLHTNRHCYATQNVTVDGSSTFQINVILQFVCMCVRVCVCVFLMVCTPHVLGLSQLGRREEPALLEGSAIYSLPAVLEWMQPKTTANTGHPQFEIGFAPQWVQGTPTIHKLRALSAAMACVSTWITGNYLGLNESLHRNRVQMALSYGVFIAYYLAVGCCRDSIADRRPATLVGGSSSATGSDRSRSGSPASPASRERR